MEGKALSKSKNDMMRRNANVVKQLFRHRTVLKERAEFKQDSVINSMYKRQLSALEHSSPVKSAIVAKSSGLYKSSSMNSLKSPPQEAYQSTQQAIYPHHIEET